MLCGTQIDPFI